MKKARAKAKFTARERVLLLVLPAALVVMLYAFMLNPKHIQALTRTTTALDKAREKSQTQGIVLDGPALDRENARLSTEKAALQRQVDAFSGGDATTTQRTEALVLLSALLRRHGLVVVEEGPAANAGTLPAVRSASKSLTAAAAPERVWQIRFLGPWSNVQAALAELRTFEAACFPVNLTMAEPRPGVDARDWTLRLRL